MRANLLGKFFLLFKDSMLFNKKIKFVKFDSACKDYFNT